MQRFDKNTSVRYKEFARTADRLRDNAKADDLEVGQMTDQIVDIDPLTKQPLENPVRNKICNHIYGKDSIVKSLQQNSRLRYVTISQSVFIAIAFCSNQIH